MIISLIGFMGCGKSSVGRRLSQLLCCPFIDLDEAVEQAGGKSVSEIFEEDGEAAFRSLELESLKGILCKESARQWTPLAPSHFVGPSPYAGVLALGGGTVMTEECAELVRKNTCCIYLRASVNTLLEHLSSNTSNRPLLTRDPHAALQGAQRRGNPSLHSRIDELMSQRSSTYEKTANIIIDTDGKSIEQICSEILC